MPGRTCRMLLLAALLLGGCSTGTFLDDIPTVWGGESRADEERREAVAAAEATPVPVEAVRGIEIGRTRDGFLITAYGTAPGLGYSLPRLRPRREGAPGLDGFVEYDFVASAPPPGFDLPPGTARTRTVRADLPVKAADLRGVAGIRVMALRGGAQLDFAATPAQEQESQGLGSPDPKSPAPQSPAPQSPGLKFPGPQSPDVQYPGLQSPGLRSPSLHSPARRS